MSSSEPQNLLGFLTCARQNPDRIALIDRDGSKSYRELKRAVETLAARLMRDIPDGAVVALLLPTNVDLVSAALACLATGHPYLPVNSLTPPARIAQTLRHAAPSAVLFSRETKALLSNAEPELICIAVEDAVKSGDINVALPNEQALADRIASIHYTSGSTGIPKGVIRSRSQVAVMIARLAAELDLTAQDRVMIGQNGATAVWHETMLAVLTCGAQFSIDLFGESLAETTDRLRQEGTTVLRCTATMLRTLTASIKTPLDTLRLVTVGSEWLFDTDLVSFQDCFSPRTRLLSVAGTTECGWISRWFIDPELKFPGHVLPAGYVAPGVTVSLVDEQDNEVAPGEIGQLVVSSPSVSNGYWRDPALTAAAFTPSTADPPCSSFRTGDTARLGANGMLELLGRNDRMIKINGTLVSLAEIEGVMRGCAGVADATVMARKIGDAVILVSYLAPTQGQDGPALTPRIREQLGLQLPARMRPAELHWIELMPRLPAGKVDLIALERIDRERIELAISTKAPPLDFSAETSAVGSAVYQSVWTAWTRLLGDAAFAENTTWDQAGGDSLKAMELLLSIETQLGLPIAAEMFSPDLSPFALIDALTKRFDASSERIQTGGTAASVPLEEAAIWPLPGDLRVRLFAHLASWPGDRPTRSRMVIGHNTTGSMPPIFWVVNAASESDVLARILGRDQPSYAFRSGAEISESSEDEIQAFALRYISEIEAICPQGPFFIGGQCLGGPIALAIAQHAVRRKRHVPLLVLMDWDFELQPYSGRVLFVSAKYNIDHNLRRRFAMPELAWQRQLGSFDFFEIAAVHAMDQDSLDILGTALKTRFEQALTAPTNVRPSEGYRASVFAERMPVVMQPGQRKQIEVVVKNESDQAWNSTSESGLTIGARWTDKDGDAFPTTGERSVLPRIGPRGSATVKLDIFAPSASGDYRVHLDVCEEGIRWFNSNPATAFTASVRVERRRLQFLGWRKVKLAPKAAELPPGPYAFDLTSRAIDLLTSGWSHPENWGTWSVGPRAKLLLPCERLRGRWRVVIVGKAFGQRGHQIIVRARAGHDGDELEWAMPGNLVVSNKFEINCAGEDLTLQFSFPQATSPKALGLGTDARQLGLGLVSMEFTRMS